MTPKQQRAWRRLSPNKRRILTSHRPDEFERQEEMRREVFADLEETFGPRQWDATVALLAEGEPTVEGSTEGDHGMTFDEIGKELGLTRSGATQVYERALHHFRKRLRPMLTPTERDAFRSEQEVFA